MLNLTILLLLFYLTWNVTVVVSSFERKDVEPIDVSKTSKVLKSSTTHENVHQGSLPALAISTTANNNSSRLNVTVTPSTQNKRIVINTNKTHIVNTTLPANVHIIATEGGKITVPAHKTKLDETGKKVEDILPSTRGTTKPSVNTSTSPEPSIQVTGKSNNQRIHGRTGVVFVPEITSTSPSPLSSTVLNKTHKKKPMYTMVPDDKETKESESVIESSSTGRDYVLFIVLMILALPIIFYIGKLIYKRGTEFTERQQYHRMYLIDGMYNSR